ncbi:SEC14-like protein 2 [Agrilus planipennis]|uniref:SEC14-like protein 2 n=1 Tax=Agrilus planipennis TaxID=224129 RepID=A0A1W4WAZ6_AGRPL|nr:SEC14-like protein 2 [Agrilus planipennis]
MAPITKPVLEDDQKFAVMKFRRQVKDVLQPHHDDVFLLRWLRARSWNVEAAEKMLRESLQWRKHWQVDDDLKTWEPPEVLKLYYPSGTCGLDNDGAPVIVVPFSGLDIVGLLHSVSKSDMIRLTIKILEENMALAAKSGVNKVVALIDMEGFNIRHYAWRPASEFVISLIQMYEANYPEILKACYIINAPRVFSVAFAVVKRFLNDYTLGKIQIFKSDPKKWQKAVLENISPDQLPKHYGGTMVDPDGDIKCPSKVKLGGKIPKSYYTQSFDKCYTLNSDNKNFKSTIIKSGKKFNIDFIIAEDGCFLRWEFYTEDHDIRFGITQEDSEGNVHPVVRYHRVASHQVNESGVIVCQAPATYTVVFDNSYSYMRNKKLFYNVYVTDPLSKLDISSLPLVEEVPEQIDASLRTSNRNESNNNCVQLEKAY